jgi:hypothetical protein
VGWEKGRQGGFWQLRNGREVFRFWLRSDMRVQSIYGLSMSMKHSFTIFVSGVAILVLGACENPPRKHPDDFAQKTHQVYNPETGAFEQSPPFGRQSNKSDAGQ